MSTTTLDAAARARRPLGFRLALILFPLGLIAGIAVALLKWVAESDDPRASVGRGQVLDEAHLADLHAKALSTLALTAEGRQAALSAFIGGTLGAAANAGYQVSEVTLQNDHAGLWQVIRRPAEGRRAGLVLWLQRPGSTPQAASTATNEAQAARLAIVLNVMEDLARLPAGERELILVIHPGTDIVSLTAREQEFADLESRLGLRHGGEHLILDELDPDPARRPDSEATSTETAPAAQEADLLPAAQGLRAKLLDEGMGN